MIIIKSDSEIEKMRAAGKVVADCHLYLEDLIKPGISTLELNDKAEAFIREAGAYPTFLGYQGYPKAICTSVNEQIVHGIPSEDVILKEGDIISIDLGATLDGYVGDAARTHGVGKISEENQKLIDATRDSFFEGIKYAKIGNRLSDISHHVQKHAESQGFSVVRDYVGHGIGRNMHEDPPIKNYGSPHHGPKLRKGMCLAIEPMINEGVYSLNVLDDGWTAVTKDGKNSAHYENTIVITEDGPEILTL